MTFSFGCTIYKPYSNEPAMKIDLNYCIVLSSEQLAYLAGSKYGIDRMKILHRLIEAAVLKETGFAMKGFSTTLQVGQAVLSEVDLSCKSGYDKKTISRVLDKLNQLGIVATTQSNRTSVHTLKCISAWMQDGNRIDNPFYVRLKDRQDDEAKPPAMSDDTTKVLSTSQPTDSDSHLKENLSTSTENGIDERTDESSLDMDVPHLGETPVVSDEGELLSPSSAFPLASASPQPAAEEESGKDVPADDKA